MKFGEWINKDEERLGKRFGYLKNVFKMFLVMIIFLVVPILLYFAIEWNPFVGLTEDGDPINLGIYIVVAIYWIGAYYIYKYHEIKKKLEKLEERNKKENPDSIS